MVQMAEYFLPENEAEDAWAAAGGESRLRRFWYRVGRPRTACCCCYVYPNESLLPNTGLKNGHG